MNAQSNAGIHQRYAALPDRERKIAEKEATLVATYAELAGVRASLVSRINEVNASLKKLEGHQRYNEWQVQSKSLHSTGVELEEHYEPLIRLTENYLEERETLCLELAKAIETENSSLHEAERKLEMLAKQVGEARSEKVTKPEKQATEASVAPAPTTSPGAAAPSNVASPSPHGPVHVSIDLDSEDNFYCGLEAAELGVFVSTIELRELNASVDVIVKLNGGREFTTQGVVRWLREWDDQKPDVYPGMGIELQALEHDIQSEIDRFIETREPWLFG